jgi:hypothetical protein
LEVNMSPNYVAVEDFEWARRRARRRDWVSFLTRKKNDLLSFDDIPPELRRGHQRYLGLQIIPLDKIVGSEGRSHEFDRAFYPREERTRDRWVSIDQAHYADVLLPPIELLKVGDAYFVRDGNHRVSVARSRGQAFIDAQVIEIAGPKPVDWAKV